MRGIRERAPCGTWDGARETDGRARDNYDNHFVCEPRAKETGQNEDETRTTTTTHTISTELKDG